MLGRGSVPPGVTTVSHARCFKAFFGITVYQGDTWVFLIDRENPVKTERKGCND